MMKTHIPMLIIKESEIDRVAEDTIEWDNIDCNKEDWSQLEACSCGAKVFYVENREHEIDDKGNKKYCRDLELHCAVCGSWIGGWSYEEGKY